MKIYPAHGGKIYYLTNDEIDLLHKMITFCSSYFEFFSFEKQDVLNFADNFRKD